MVVKKIENPTKKVIDNQTQELIDKLLLEKISLAGISRVTGVSEKWLQDYVNSKSYKTSRQIKSIDEFDPITVEFLKGLKILYPLC